MSPTLRSFQIQNYKSIRDSGEIKVPGISLILGPNGSGKTNILESLLLLKQTFENNQTDLKLNGNIIKTGEFKNIIHGKVVDRDLTYRFNFDRDLDGQDPELICPVCEKEYVYRGYFTNHMEDEHNEFWDKHSENYTQFSNQYAADPYIEFEYTFDKQSKSNQLKSVKLGNPSPSEGLYVSSIELLNEGEGIRIIVDDIYGDTILDIGSKEKEDSEIIELNPNYVRRQMAETLYSHLPHDFEKSPFFYYHVPEGDTENTDYIKISNETKKIADYLHHREEIEKSTQNDDVKGLASGLISRLLSITETHGRMISLIQAFLRNIHHVGPLRNSPRRIYFGAGGSPGLQAESGNQVEERIFSAERSQDRELIEKTNKWLSETGFDCRLDVSEVGVGDLYQLEVIQSGLSINLADAGFGLSQTIPIIIECLNMQMGDDSSTRSPVPKQLQRGVSHPPLGLIEQPEIHLNPRIEASLGDFFIDVMNSGSRLMIETHSEHLLNRLQRRVADDSIENEDNMVIYFISNEEGESTIKEIEISSSGVFSDWPDGFFQDDFEDAVEILKESL